jgi:hypothetical protein
MNKEFVLSLVRHALTVAAGALVTKGFADQGQAEALAGGVLAAIAILWSYLAKREDQGPPATGRILGLILCIGSACTLLSGCEPWRTTVGVTTSTPYGTFNVGYTLPAGITGTPDKQIAGLAK